jgi:hypothetical protein
LEIAGSKRQPALACGLIAGFRFSHQPWLQVHENGEVVELRQQSF